MTAKTETPASGLAPLLGLMLLAGTAYGAENHRCPHSLVATETMSRELNRIAAKGYDIDATTNQARFIADFLFGLAGRPGIAGPAGTFQIQPQRFFDAWLAATGAAPDEAPTSMQKVLEFNQRFVVDTSPRVQLELPAGAPEPRILSVLVSWPESHDAPNAYSFEDRLSDPHVRLRHERVIRYLLLDFGTFVAYERVEGISGRPTSGPLGALFSLLGMAEMRSSRLAIAEDGTQVNRTRVHKLFNFTALAVVEPDGRASRGLPADRPDLEALASGLELDIEIQGYETPTQPCPLQQ
ncbi:MAG: hypothetical protein RQ741_05570 [Wenzhouxiangellaceae bacterium]|nr:hypothetical protein [Wenzhouxiangellaceae bacterium]